MWGLVGFKLHKINYLLQGFCGTPSDMEKTTATSDAPTHGTSTKHKASSAAAGSATPSGASSPRLVVVSPKGCGDAGASGGRSSDRGRVDDGAETQRPAKARDSALPDSSGSPKSASAAAEVVTPPPAAVPVPKSRKAKAVEFLAGFFSGNPFLGL